MLFSSSSVIRSTASVHNGTAVGWVSSSTDRGTIDILWSCSITIFLCCWVATHPNPGAATDKWYHPFIDKIHLTLIGLLGPEFLFGIALGQFSSARRCVRLFRRDSHLLNGTKWTYQYSFFVNMGGIHLTSPDFPSGFPITGQQLHYLVQHDHIDFPDMKAMAVDERNATDTLSRLVISVFSALNASPTTLLLLVKAPIPNNEYRLVTVWQVLWFSVAEIQRVRQGLSTTTIEITALSYVAATIATSVCWFRKPAIKKPQTIATKNGKLMYNIRAEAQEQTHPDLKLEVWYRTPMDFVNDDIWGIETHWFYYARLTHLAHFLVVSRPINTRPWNRFPSDQWLPPNIILLPFAALVHLAFNVSFLIPWNFHFPTKAEQWLWRALSLYQLIFAVYGGIYYIIEVSHWQKRISMDKTQGNFHDPTNTSGRTAQTPINSPLGESDSNLESHFHRQAPVEPASSRGDFGWHWKVRRWIASWRNISPDMDPRMEMRLRVLIPLTIASALYIWARLLLYIQDLASLRLQPADTYESVNKFLPFLGDG
ncbi:hypothetical protein GGR51DRAFT_564588 [Nemania sp. FL0031]|nr:hypothetical protein GGR51DRAFT_564588 [Nemania sp. FL0031]